MTGKTNLSRRALVAGGAALGLGAVASVGLGTSMVPPAQADEPQRQFGFLVKTENCVNCQRCVMACRESHDTPPSQKARRKVYLFETSYGNSAYVSLSCMHCAKPSCMTVCPSGAIQKTTDGIVTVDQDRCIGCKYCNEACPFDVPQYTSEGMDKCDCCLGVGIAPGETPYCAQACIFDALFYGELSELEANAHGTAHRIESSTEPSVLLA